MPSEFGLSHAYLRLAVAGLAAYLIGSFPTGVILSTLKKGPDVRYSGSGHTGATNTMRLLGLGAGATVGLIDGAKGLIAWAVAYLVMQGSPWALPLAGTLAVVGHCWPIYTRFHGGMGLGTGVGLALVVSPITIGVTALLWAGLYFGLFKQKFSPRAVTVALPLAVAMTLLFIPLEPNSRWFLVSVTLVLIIRHWPEWNRER